MRQLEKRELIHVLVKAYNTTLTDYYYFPEVVFAGRHRIEKEAFDYLKAEGYLYEIKHDSFGRFYKLSKKADDLIASLLSVRHQPKRKKSTAFVAQPLLF